MEGGPRVGLRELREPGKVAAKVRRYYETCQV